MKILHMSDLHFGFDKDETSKAIRNNYYDMLCKKLEEISRTEKLDLIVITGDIGWHAHKNDYVDASKFIKNISEICKVDLTNIFICPGNHDVSRTWLDDKEFPTNQKRANELLRIERLTVYEEAFASYSEFCNSLGLSQYIIGNKKNFLVGVFSSVNFNIVCINTAWYAKSSDVKDKMWVGSNFIEVIKADKIINNSNFTITILHHPSKSWHEHETSFYSGVKNTHQKIIELSNMVLFGHTHEIKNNVLYKDTTFTCGTGSLYEDSNYRNNFQIYHVDLRTKHVAKKIEYSFDNDEWIKKTWINEKQPTELRLKTNKSKVDEFKAEQAFSLSDIRIPKKLIIRSSLNSLFDECIEDTNVIVVEGIKGSGKDYFIKSYFETNKIKYPNVILYYASEGETIDHFLININIDISTELSGLSKYIELFDILYKNNIVIVAYGISRVDIPSFLPFIKAAAKYGKDIKIILVADSYVDFGIDSSLMQRFPINQFTDVEVHDFLFLKKINNISNEMMEKLILKTESLPIALEAFCTLVTDLNNDPEYLLSDTFVNISQRLDSWFNHIVGSLDNITYKVLQILSVYEKPFSSGLVKIILLKFFPSVTEEQNIIFLQRTHLIYKVTSFRWKVHNLFADFCKRRISDKDKNEIHNMLAEYCLYNSRTKYSKINFNEELKWLEKACFHFQSANMFSQSERILKGKFSKKLKQLGCYEIYLKLCEKEIINNKSRSIWLDYNYSHCALIIGNVQKAKKVLTPFANEGFNICEINQKLSIVRLYSEILCEQGHVKEALTLLESEINKVNLECIQKNIYSQVLHRECLLLLELGMIHEAKKIIERIRCQKINQGNIYGLAISSAIEAIIYETIEDYKQALSQYEIALTKMIHLNDRRGESWIKFCLGICYLKHGSTDTGLQYVCDAIKIKRNISECSRDYLSQLKDVLSLHNIGSETKDMIKNEILRVGEIRGFNENMLVTKSS